MCEGCYHRRNTAEQQANNPLTLYLLKMCLHSSFPPHGPDQSWSSKAPSPVSNYDWIEIRLNAYRARWLQGEAWDSRYDAPQNQLREVEYLSTPTLMIQRIIATRVVLQNAGHFLHHEAWKGVALVGIGTENAGRRDKRVAADCAIDRRAQIACHS